MLLRERSSALFSSIFTSYSKLQTSNNENRTNTRSLLFRVDHLFRRRFDLSIVFWYFWLLHSDSSDRSDCNEFQIWCLGSHIGKSRKAPRWPLKLPADEDIGWLLSDRQNEARAQINCPHLGHISLERNVPLFLSCQSGTFQGQHLAENAICKLLKQFID